MLLTWHHLATSHRIDMKSGYRTRSLLCMPIIESNSGKILGATQMINKLDGSFFSDEDEEMLRAITVHVAVAMTNASVSVGQRRSTVKNHEYSTFIHNEHSSTRLRKSSSVDRRHCSKLSRQRFRGRMTIFTS